MKPEFSKLSLCGQKCIIHSCNFIQSELLKARACEDAHFASSTHQNLISAREMCHVHEADMLFVSREFDHLLTLCKLVLTYHVSLDSDVYLLFSTTNTFFLCLL